MHVFCADDAWADGYVSARSPKNAGGRRDLTRARSRASEPAAAAAGERSAGGGAKTPSRTSQGVGDALRCFFKRTRAPAQFFAGTSVVVPVNG